MTHFGPEYFVAPCARWRVWQCRSAFYTRLENIFCSRVPTRQRRL